MKILTGSQDFARRKCQNKEKACLHSWQKGTELSSRNPCYLVSCQNYRRKFLLLPLTREATSTLRHNVLKVMSIDNFSTFNAGDVVEPFILQTSKVSKEPLIHITDLTLLSINC